MGEGFITEEENSIYVRRMRGRGWERFQSMTIVILVIIILLMQKCSGGGIFNNNKRPVEEKVITKIDTVWQEVEIEKEVYVPKWRTKVVTEHDTVEVLIPQEIDTLSILKDYYTQYQYIDTLF